MAKRICRTANRFDPTGVPWPRCCVRRATPSSHAAVVHEPSQRGTDAFIFGEGCAGLARRRTSRAHSLPPNSRRATPSIYPDLIYDRHNQFRHQKGSSDQLHERRSLRQEITRSRGQSESKHPSGEKIAKRDELTPASCLGVNTPFSKALLLSL